MSIHYKYMVVLVACFFAAEKTACSFSESVGTIPVIDSISSGFFSCHTKDTTTMDGDASSFTDPSSDTASKTSECPSPDPVIEYRLITDFDQDDTLVNGSCQPNSLCEQQEFMALTSQNLQQFFNYKLYQKIQRDDQDARERAKEIITLRKVSSEDAAQAIAKFRSSQSIQGYVDTTQQKPVSCGCFSFLRK